MIETKKYESFESVLNSVINTSDDIVFWKKRFSDGLSKIPEIYRKENIYFNLFEKIVHSINPQFKLDRQVKVDRYLIDAIYEYNSINYGDLIKSEKETLNCIYIFEFDESYHKYQKLKDDFRMKIILSEINKCYDIVEVFRIQENNAYQFLAYAIPFFGNIETSFSLNKMIEYSDYKLICNNI